jgi:hypothetical protein
MHFMVSLAASEHRIGTPVVLGFYPKGWGLVGLAIGSFYYWVSSSRAALGGPASSSLIRFPSKGVGLRGSKRFLYLIN